MLSNFLNNNNNSFSDHNDNFSNFMDDYEKPPLSSKNK